MTAAPQDDLPPAPDFHEWMMALSEWQRQDILAHGMERARAARAPLVAEIERLMIERGELRLALMNAEARAETAESRLAEAEGMLKEARRCLELTMWHTVVARIDAFLHADEQRPT